MHRRLVTADGGEIDDAVVLWFPDQQSATGEPVAEFHVHGGRSVVQRLFDELSALEGFRSAEPGEFTRRAFENGKIDLTQAEAIDDLVHSDNDAQRRHALRQLGGLLGNRIEAWRRAIIEAAALVEAGIDFSEEEDVPQTVESAQAIVRKLLADVISVLDQPSAERLREGIVVAIVGAPNVGKSTLMNRLTGRDIAIVSPHAGTTRDVIEVRCDFGGYPVTLMDTAGLRDTSDPVEQEGIRRARVRAEAADLRLWLVDDDDADDPPRPAGETWVVRNKSDLIPRRASVGAAFSVSASTGEGVSALIAALGEFARTQMPGENAMISRQRHREMMEAARDALQAVLRERAPELIAEELRRASHAFGRLLGRFDVEDVLDSIFGKFCIGK